MSNIVRLFGKIVASNKRGSFNLVFNGNRYYKNNDNKSLTKTFWRCSQKARCNGAITTVYFNRNVEDPLQEIEVVQVGKGHTHEA